MSKEIYVSIDVESDGPIPIQNSMLALGAVAFTDDGRILGEYNVNLKPIPGAVQDPGTMEWWATQEAAWKFVTSRTVTPEVGMRTFRQWCAGLLTLGHGDRLVPVCAPVGYDFTFLYVYLMKFGGESPFRFSALDVRSFLAGFRGVRWFRTSKRHWKKEWFKGTPNHTHKPLDDAKGQGMAFMRMRAEALLLAPPTFEKVR